MKFTRRGAIASLAAAATGLGPAGVLADAAPVTVLQLRRRNIAVNGKAASVFEIAQPDGTVGLYTKVGDRFRVRAENAIDEPSLNLRDQGSRLLKMRPEPRKGGKAWPKSPTGSAIWSRIPRSSSTPMPSMTSSRS